MTPVKVTFSTSKVVCGLNECLDAEQNSEDLKKPKKAVVKAAHSISLSTSGYWPWRRASLSCLNIKGVTGMRC